MADKRQIRTSMSNSVMRQDGAQPARSSQARNDQHLIRLWLHGKSANTREAYARDIEQFQSFVSEDLVDVKLQDIHGWSTHLGDRDLAESTVARKLASVKSLFSFAHKIGYLAFNVGAAVKSPSVPDDLAERILDKEAVMKVISNTEPFRDKMIVRLFYASGGRVSELSSLKWQSVILRRLKHGKAGGQITLLGKGNKKRSILLTPTTWRALQSHRDSEIESGFGRSADPVFRSRKGGCLSRQQLWKIVKDAAAAAGLPHAVSPHWLRHAHASHALDEGAPVHLVKETLGHKSLATTSRYTHARPDDSSSNYLEI